ncbi:glutathione S-transferase family protein [Rhizobium sp.]
MLKLFYAPGTCALASRIALEEAGADYEIARLNFAESEQRSAEFLRINPKGRVPALVTDRGVLTETPAILIYVAQAFPAANLAMLDDAYEFARLQAFNAYIASTVHVNHAHGRRGARWANQQSSFDDMKSKVAETMAASMRMIELDFFEGPWVMGEQYTVADGYLYTMSSWLAGDGVDINEFPILKDHFERMSARPAVQRVLADI